ncbi:MAG TPA: OB-fold nucleic acid binding domain-containing protein, partial [Burkholderiaceae bacterium]|nr:OB-fold nucleic acid binding domain-containing protein [Burkholderiaceae bacterium]
MTDTSPTQTVDENRLIAERRSKLNRWRNETQAYPNDFSPKNTAAELHGLYDDSSKEALEEKAAAASIAGRMMLKRVMGKASFATLQDASGQIQIFLDRRQVGDDIYQQFRSWDIGDILAVEGQVFKTNRGELSIQVERIRLLSKALRPLPDKHHGLVDHEL